MSTSYTPLFDPEKDVHAVVPTLQRAIEQARKFHDEKGRANLHDKDEMIRAAVSLHYVLHDLLAALDAERGEGQ